MSGYWEQHLHVTAGGREERVSLPEDRRPDVVLAWVRSVLDPEAFLCENPACGNVSWVTMTDIVGS